MKANKTARVGMVGAGQLARMTHQAAIDLGIGFAVLARSPSDPAVLSGAEAVFGDYRDPDAVLELAERCDVVTFDHELVPCGLIKALEEKSFVVRPGSESFMYSQDKLYAKTRLKEAGFAVPDFLPLDPGVPDSLVRFAAAHRWPVVVKSRSGGYDGRGVWVVRDEEEAKDFADKFLGNKSAAGTGVSGSREHKDDPDQDNFVVGNKQYEFILENHVEIEKEIAILGVRRPGGEFLAYEPIETVQRNGICNELFMPADISVKLAKSAKETAFAIAETVGAVGLVAIEMFVDGDSNLMINELALRPHNSGHATIEAAYTSQFQNHLRAVLDWPLGSADMKVPAAVMVNILGGRNATDPRELLESVAGYPTVAVHLYGKEPVPGRKLGHVTATGKEREKLFLLAKSCAEELTD